MNIVIVGGGLVGSTLAARLSRVGHDVTLVEGDHARARVLMEQLDVRVLEGNGATAGVLRDAAGDRADLLVASTNSDEANLVVGMLARAALSVERVVLRLREPGHAETFEILRRSHGGEMVAVNPEGAAVDRILSLLEVPGAADVVSFLEGRLVVAGFRIGPESDLAGLPVSNVSLLFPVATLVVAIQRLDRWIIPHAEDEILAGDLVYLAIARAEMENVLTLFGGAPRGGRQRVMVAGAHRIGLEVARRLGASGRAVVLVEESGELARRAEGVLERVLVIRGAVTDQAVLEEENIAGVETFVALTPDHETNLVSSLLAKKLGARRAFAMVDNPALVNLIGAVGIDAVISPRLLAVGLAMQQIGRGRIHAVAPLLEDKIEAIEAEAEAGSRLTAGTLSQVKLPRGVVVAARCRAGALIVPRGGDRIEPGDLVLVITTTETAARLDEYLAGR